MYYKVEFDIDRFEFWSGAKDRMDNATPEQIEKVKERIESYFEGCEDIENIPSDTTINDIVWFECDDIFFPEEEEEENEDDE